MMTFIDMLLKRNTLVLVPSVQQFMVALNVLLDNPDKGTAHVLAKHLQSYLHQGGRQVAVYLPWALGVLLYTTSWCTASCCKRSYGVLGAVRLTMLAM